MYHWIVNMRLQAILECFVDDVIRSQNKSKLWTTIALSKFELEKRSTAQNVPNWTGYQKFKFQFHIQISKFWQVSNLRLPFHLFVTCQNFTEIWQVCSFNGLSVCLFVCVSRDTVRSFWPIITKLGPHMESGPSHRCILFIGRRSNN